MPRAGRGADHETLICIIKQGPPPSQPSCGVPACLLHSASCLLSSCRRPLSRPTPSRLRKRRISKRSHVFHTLQFSRPGCIRNVEEHERRAQSLVAVTLRPQERPKNAGFPNEPDSQSHRIHCSADHRDSEKRTLPWSSRILGPCALPAPAPQRPHRFQRRFGHSDCAIIISPRGSWDVGRGVCRV
jgi:hypothetical protein